MSTVTVDKDLVTITTDRGTANQVAAILYVCKEGSLQPGTLDLRTALSNMLVGPQNVKRVKPAPGTPDASLDRIERVIYGGGPGEMGNVWIAHPGSPLPDNRLGVGSRFGDRWPVEWIRFGAEVESPKLGSGDNSNVMWLRTSLTLPDTVYMLGWQAAARDVRIIFTKLRLVYQTTAITSEHSPDDAVYEFLLEEPDTGLKPWLAFVAVEES